MVHRLNLLHVAAHHVRDELETRKLGREKFADELAAQNSPAALAVAGVQCERANFSQGYAVFAG